MPLLKMVLRLMITVEDFGLLIMKMKKYDQQIQILSIQRILLIHLRNSISDAFTIKRTTLIVAKIVLTD